MDALAFRHAASRFVTGVTVLTALDEHGAFCGMTANSFVTVSLSPPTVLVSVKPGRMHDAIRRGARYAVNVLPQQARELSFAFSGRTKSEAAAYELCDRLPRLDGCVAFFACEVRRSVEIGDHTLFIAEVSRCDHSDEAPLVFFASRYHLGPGAPV